jgi:hypothetical protein
MSRMLLASPCRHSVTPSAPLSIDASNIFVAQVALVVTEITESAFTYFLFSKTKLAQLAAYELFLWLHVQEGLLYGVPELPC